MNRRRLTLLILLAVAGYGALALLAPRFNPAARWNFLLDRPSAIARAREEARRSGLDVAHWQAVVTSAYQGPTAYFMTRHPASAKKAMLSPVVVSVMLAEPDAPHRQWHVGLTADGKLDSFLLKYPAQKKTTEAATNATNSTTNAANDAPTPARDATQARVAPERTREIASAALARLVGDEAGQFSLVSELDEAGEGFRYVWERSFPGEEDFKLQVIGVVQGEEVRELRLFTYFSPNYLDIYNNRRNETRWLDLLNVFLNVILVIAVASFYFYGWVRGEINHRLALSLFFVIFLLGLVRALFGSTLDSQMATNYETGAMRLTLVVTSLFIVIPLVFVSVMLVMFWITGDFLARRSDLRRSAATFVGLLKGRLLSRLIASRIATGILLGGIMGALPFVVAALGIFPNMQLDAPDSSLFIARAPALATVLQPLNSPLWVVYGFLVPLFAAYIRRPRLALALTLLVGLALLMEEDMYHASLGGALAVAGLSIILADQIFRRFDFLTLIIAALAADIANAAWSFLVQPERAQQGVGWRALVTLAVLLSIALIGSWKGREEVAAATDDEDETTRASTALQRAERERLMAEFGVARTAQQHMLPDVPPRVSGYDITGTCRPAREVGGDLYDFLVLPNERIGIVVADVSGKGVPAALYMTLTKGLLASIAENESDPAAIVREVNRHLYEVCRRKVFVTMLLGVLDPATNTFTYARAGHNPGIWRRTSEQASTLLRAAGLGLGLSGSKIFDRSLRSETIKIERGDAVLLYSDGITEAMNAQGEEYGEERLLDAIARTDGLGAAATQEAVLADVGAFLGETSPQDDITLVVVRVSEG